MDIFENKIPYKQKILLLLNKTEDIANKVNDCMGEKIPSQ